MSFLNEIKRRNVIRVAGLYLAGAWLILQVAGTVLPMMGAPIWLSRGTVIALAIGFIPALIFAWAFELTPEGLKRESEVDRTASTAPHSTKTLDRVIMVVLALALGYFAFDRFVLAPQRNAAVQQQQSAEIAAAREEGRAEARDSYSEKSIVVLPFVNMSSDKEQEYFSDGLSEELLNLLAGIPELRVISRTSSFSYKGKDIKLAQVADELNVAHVLEGSVRRSGNKIRITAQLVEARSDTHLWSQTWDREINDIFAVQDEIAGAVVQQLKITLLGALPKAKVVDPRAFALFLKARQVGRLGTPEGFTQAISLYEQALKLDPNNAAAWSGLANVYTNQAIFSLRPADEAYRLAREATNKALAVDPGFSRAHASLGRIAMNYEGDLAAAARHFERALALDPANPDIMRDFSTLAKNVGRIDVAIALQEFSNARDPLNAVGQYNLGVSYLWAGRMDEAIASSRAALNLNPERIVAHYNIGVALLLKGEPVAALAEMQRETGDDWRQIGLPIAYHALGQRTASDTALADLIQHHAQDSAYNIAYVLAFRGEVDRAFEWLDRAVKQSDSGLVEIVGNPLFANLHEDQRWLPFLRKIGKAPEQLAAIKFDVKLPQ